MKRLLFLLFLIPFLASAQTNVTPGLPISRYPRVSSMDAPDIFIIARTNISPATNMGVTFLVLSNDIASMLATTNYVNAATNMLGFSFLFNPDQFAPSSGVTNIKDGALLTNLSSVTITNRGATVHTPAAAAGASAVFVNDGTKTFLTNILAADATVIVSNLNEGQSIKWFLFSSNGARNMTFPQVTRSNSNTRGFIPQPFTNTWTSFFAARHGVVTNFVFDGQEFNLGAGTNTVLVTNQADETITVNVSPPLSVITNLIVSGSGSTNFINLSVQAAKLPPTNFPGIDAGWNEWGLIYYKTNMDGSNYGVSGTWQFIVPQDYATNSMTLRMQSFLFLTNGPNPSNTIFGVSVLRGVPDATNDLHFNLTYGTEAFGTNVWSGTSRTNTIKSLTIPIGTNSQLNAGDFALLRLRRDATNDTIWGATTVIGLQLEYIRK